MDCCLSGEFFQIGALLWRRQVSPGLLGRIARDSHAHPGELPQAAQPRVWPVGSRKEVVGIQEEHVHHGMASLHRRLVVRNVFWIWTHGTNRVGNAPTIFLVDRI
jgi:hypothetical protein